MCSVTIDHNIYLYGQEVKVMFSYCTIDTGNYPGGTNSHIVTETYWPQEVKVMCYYSTVDSGNYPGGTSSHIVTEYILATTLQSHQLTDTIWTCPGLPDVKWIYPDVLP